MTATDITDLDALLDALEARAVERAAATPLLNAAGVPVALAAATGRLVVNPGDTIASLWGNTTYDQTIQVYTSTADRDAQWPTPHDGALAYTTDTGNVWLRRVGVWVAVTPIMGSAPAAAVTLSGLTPIPLGTPTFDTFGGFGAAGYTVRLAGYYWASMRVTVAGVPASNGPAFRIQRNTVDLITGNIFNGSSIASTLTCACSDIVLLQVNDVIRMAIGNTGGTVTAGPAAGALTLQRIGGI